MTITIGVDYNTRYTVTDYTITLINLPTPITEANLAYVFNITQGVLYYAPIENESKITVTGNILAIPGFFPPIQPTDKIHIQIYTQEITDDASIDAFARKRVSNPYTVFETKHINDALPLFYDDKEVSGTGTSSVFSKNRASVTLSVSNLTAGKRVRQSKIRGIYQSGKSSLAFTTAVFGGISEGIIRRLGYFDDENGLFFKSNDVLSVNIRSNVTGTPVDTEVTQSNWNIDKLDGTGSSGVLLDLTKSQIFFFDFEWLGVGRVRFGFVINGIPIYCHEFLNSNNLSSVYMSTPNLPIRYEIENDGTGEAASIEHICSTFISEGGQDNTYTTTFVSRGDSQLTLANAGLWTPVASIRLKDGHYNTKPTIDDVSVLITSVSNIEWAVFINPTVADVDNASWVSVTNSALEYDISRNSTNTLTGGYKINGGYTSSTNQFKSSVLANSNSFLSIGFNIDNTKDELVLAVRNVSANGGTCFGGLTIKEVL